MTTAEEKRVIRLIIALSISAVALFIAMGIFTLNRLENARDIELQACLREKTVSECYIDMMSSD